jgi:hypothetical protein
MPTLRCGYPRFCVGWAPPTSFLLAPREPAAVPRRDASVASTGMPLGEFVNDPAGEFLLFRPTFVSPYFSSRAAEKLAQPLAGP